MLFFKGFRQRERILPSPLKVCSADDKQPETRRVKRPVAIPFDQAVV
jgi:hypothetical protein